MLSIEDRKEHFFFSKHPKYFRPKHRWPKIGNRIWHWRRTTPWFASGASSIQQAVADLINDNEAFEDDEPRPTVQAIDTLVEMLHDTETRYGAKIPYGKISTWYGEVAVTWRVENRILRLSAYSDPSRTPLMYFQTDNGEALTRGESIRPVLPEFLASKLFYKKSGSKNA